MSLDHYAEGLDWTTYNKLIVVRKKSQWEKKQGLHFSFSYNFSANKQLYYRSSASRHFFENLYWSPDFLAISQFTALPNSFWEEVQASLDDPRPSIPHEQVMEEMNALMESMRKSAEAD